MSPESIELLRAARRLNGLVESAQKRIAAYLPPDGGSPGDCLRDLIGIFDGPEQRKAQAAFARAAEKVKHIHVAGTTIGRDIDECAACGFDLRDSIHHRA